MASELPLLSLDLGPPTPTPAISSSFPEFLTRFFVTEFADFGEFSKINEFVNGLQDELKKIQAFQRELPLSFLLLNDAIRKLKEMAKRNEEKRWDDGKFDGSIGVKLGIDEYEKKTWMSSAQLWSPTSEEDEYEAPRKHEEKGVLLSFTEVTDDVPRLSLVPPGLKTTEAVEPDGGKPGTGGIFSGSVFSTQTAKIESKASYQTARKRRRCWSPELHRRFVDALEKLGGSRVATPKQIRELMQVDGLTNDEVKSHLQKYRLHVRKVPAPGITTELSTGVGIGCGDDQLEMGCSTMDLEHSSSPKGPLHLERLRKCNSSSGEEDEEETSNDHSWKLQHHM